MPDHTYTPLQALELLMRKVAARDAALAVHIQEAIDAGKDVPEVEPSLDRRRKPRIYRKKVAYSPEEALGVALDALQAYFVEQPLFIDSAAQNLAKAAIGTPKHPIANWAYSSLASEPEPIELGGIDQTKEILIEIQTETQLSRVEEETFPLKAKSRDEIAAQQRQIAMLHHLITFEKK
jgi:hypothetical protein